jgi:hypothetical protein
MCALQNVFNEVHCIFLPQLASTTLQFCIVVEGREGIQNIFKILLSLN